MPDEQRNTYRYRILRYTPNLIRDEWVNIGVLLEEVDGAKRAMRLIEEPGEIARVRRLHPNADEELLRALPAEFDARLRATAFEVGVYLEKLDQTLSNVLQLSPVKGLLAEDFDAELDRLYHDHVSPPPRTRAGIVESTRGWIKARLNDVFRRHRVPKLARNIRVEEFTQAGDPLRLDYGYQNGVRGYLHAMALGRDPSQAKVLAYTAEHIRRSIPSCEFTAITEMEPARDNPRHQFVMRLLEDQRISIVPLNRVEKFAEELRKRLQ
ncbi:MAG: DUF3037 domain-containing protein [Candidatus Acidiferrales bacterium]